MHGPGGILESKGEIMTIIPLLALLCRRPYGLRRSSLIMGVHPGCSVSSTVAASLVAVETDVGETIPAAKVTLNFVCGPWSVGSCCASFCRPLFPTSAFTSFYSPFLRCWFRVLLHIVRSAARSSQDSVLMSSAVMSILQTSLWQDVRSNKTISEIQKRGFVVCSFKISKLFAEIKYYKTTCVILLDVFEAEGCTESFCFAVKAVKNTPFENYLRR